MSGMSEREELVVPVEAAGWRLDQFLAGQLSGVSRSRVQQLVEQGDVLVEGKREKASLKLRGGEQPLIAVQGISYRSRQPLEHSKKVPDSNNFCPLIDPKSKQVPLVPGQ